MTKDITSNHPYRRSASPAKSQLEKKAERTLKTAKEIINALHDSLIIAITAMGKDSKTAISAKKSTTTMAKDLKYLIAKLIDGLLSMKAKNKKLKTEIQILKAKQNTDFTF